MSARRLPVVTSSTAADTSSVLDQATNSSSYVSNLTALIDAEE